MTPDPTPRINSLDQFRGYTVAAMLVVNFLSSFKQAAHPLLLHHNTYCSFADLVMPQFLFAVGFSLRLVSNKYTTRIGTAPTKLRFLKRSLALVLFGCLFYGLDGSYKSWDGLQQLGLTGFFANSFHRVPLQTLTHIGLTTLWLIPVIHLSVRSLVFFATASGLLHLGLSYLFWYDFAMAKPVIDGGLLGFLTWTVPTVAGAVAHDWVATSPRTSLKPLLLAGTTLMLLGYALSCLGNGGGLAAPPFFAPTHEPGLFTMSQRAGSLSYLTFAAGFSLALMAAFVAIADIKHFKLTLFHDLGSNAFAAYVIHMITLNTTGNFAPRDAPLYYATAYTLTLCLLGWAMTRWCNRRNLYLRL